MMGLLTAGGAGGTRRAPLVADSADAQGGLRLGRGRIVDHLVMMKDGQRRVATEIDAFLFDVEEVPEGLTEADAILNLMQRNGMQRNITTHVRISRGSELRLPVGLRVTPDLEGAFHAILMVGNQAKKSLFIGSYSFGYPRYDGSGNLQRVSTSATIRDDFEGDEIDRSLWRIWISDPGSFRTEQRDGRYWIYVKGEVGYNGLSSIVEMDTRDVVAVCRTGVESPGGAVHSSIMHLCGGGKWSPDYWYELDLRDTRGEIAQVFSVVALPPRLEQGYRGAYVLPHPATDGYLEKIECVSATHVCTGYVQVDGEWWQVGDPFEVPARKTRLEIKTSGSGEGKGSSTIWFDDCRVYPRPETHFLTVVLRRRDRWTPGTSATEGGDLQMCYGPDNTRLAECDFVVQLYKADGKTLVDETHTAKGFGYALLRLDGAGWDVYPVPARIRVLANGHQIGPDHVIDSEGVDGLYPDDVYAITLE